MSRQSQQADRRIGEAGGGLGEALEIHHYSRAEIQPAAEAPQLFGGEPQRGIGPAQFSAQLHLCVGARHGVLGDVDHQGRQ